MWRTIEKWRNKDERTRRVAALSIALVVTLIIAGFWAVIFVRSPSVKQVTGAKQSISDIKKPLDSFGETTATAWGQFKEQFGKLTETIQALKQEGESVATTTATSAAVVEVETSTDGFMATSTEQVN